MRTAKISSGVLFAHANALAKSMAKYPITRVEIKVMHSRVMEETLDIVILGQLPKRIIVGFVKNKMKRQSSTEPL